MKCIVTTTVCITLALVGCSKPVETPVADDPALSHLIGDDIGREVTIRGVIDGPVQVMTDSTYWVNYVASLQSGLILDGDVPEIATENARVLLTGRLVVVEGHTGVESRHWYPGYYVFHVDETILCDDPDAPETKIDLPEFLPSWLTNALSDLQDTDGVTCTVSADKDVVSPDETVTLTFRLHNPTDHEVRFVLAKGRHTPWVSTPLWIGPDGPISSTWPMPRYVGAGRPVLEVIVIPAGGDWEAVMLTGKLDPGTYTFRAEFAAMSPADWLERGNTPHDELRPIGLDAIRDVGDAHFLAGSMVSEPITFACR